jgi:hypothetical protein
VASRVRGEAARAFVGGLRAPCWWQRTSTESNVTQRTICSRIDGDHRISISGRTLILTDHGERSEVPLASDGALLAACREHLGITLPPGAVAARRETGRSSRHTRVVQVA